MSVSIYEASASDVTSYLAAESVQTVVTSPPYYGLREYVSLEPEVWGGRRYCQHEWDDAVGDTCLICGAWRGELGHEPEPRLYASHLADVFDQIKKVLRPDGTVWLNLGDTYAGSGRGPSGRTSVVSPQEEKQGFRVARRRRAPAGYKNKDLMGIPWLVAEELRRRGWYVRAQIIWHKTNAKPESVGDRPTVDYETIFLLSKSQCYFYNRIAAREPGVLGEDRRLRSVWSFAVETRADHQAPFPLALASRCVRLGTPELGATVLDPFCGSGTTALASVRAGRRFVGLDVSPASVCASRKRLEGEWITIN